MQDFKHYLVTRYNVVLKNWTRDKYDQPIGDKIWMDDRLRLFRKYCIPSVAAQTNHHFEWLIYCDCKTNPDDLNHISNSIATLDFAQIRLVEDFDDLLQDLRLLLSAVKTPFVITSRLDNDDGLGKNTIQTIQDHFSEKDKMLLNPLSGIMYDTHEKVLTELKKSQRNHYTSLIEKTKNPSEMITVLGFAHDKPPADIMIENLSAQGAWLKIIHEKNLKSTLKGKPILKINSGTFDQISNEAFPVSLLNTLKYIGKRIFEKTNDHFFFKRK